jgi:hypothetical protein
MSDLTDLSFNKSQSMTDIISGDSGLSGYPWGARQFGKSLSASAIVKDVY